MLASFTSTDSESENPPLGNPLRFRTVENRSKDIATVRWFAIHFGVAVCVLGMHKGCHRRYR